MIFSFLAIFHVLQCTFFIFHVFQYFSPYSRSNSVFVLFSMSFQYSCHIPDPTVCISHFPLFSMSLAIFHFLQCIFFIFHYFQFSCHTPGPTVCISNFSRFPILIAIFHFLPCVFLIFQCFSVFLPYSRSYTVHYSFSTFSIVSRHIPG